MEHSQSLFISQTIRQITDHHKIKSSSFAGYSFDESTFRTIILELLGIDSKSVCLLIILHNYAYLFIRAN